MGKWCLIILFIIIIYMTVIGSENPSNDLYLKTLVVEDQMIQGLFKTVYYPDDSTFPFDSVSFIFDGDTVTYYPQDLQ